MAKMNFVTKENPKQKRTIPLGRKWRRWFLVSVTMNLIQALTTIYILGYFDGITNIFIK